VTAFDVSRPDGPWAGAIVLHPHPDMGGDRHNSVVSALFAALPAIGVTGCRFDFSSSEVEAAGAQVVEALDLLEPDGLPIYLVGYSFGGGIGATVLDERIAGWYLVAPALSLVTPTIGGDPRPKGIAAAAHDQWFGPDAIAAATDGWVATAVDIISGADHFFAGRTDAVAERCTTWLQSFSRQ